MLEFLKLILITAVPAFLIYRRHHMAALAWLCIVTPLDLLGTSFRINIKPQAAFGLVALPFVLHQIRQWRGNLTKSEAYVLGSFLLLVLGMIVYGFLFPWPDTTGERPLNQMPQGRSVIYTIRSLGELGVVLYIAYIIQKQGSPPPLFKWLLIGTTLCAAGVFLQLITGHDLFLMFNSNEARDFSNWGRSRGINYEPRGAGQWCVVGILLCLGLKTLGKIRWPLLFFHAAAIIPTFSTSALLILGPCLLVLSVIEKQARRFTIAAFASGSVLILLLASTPSFQAVREVYALETSRRLLMQSADSETVFVPAFIKDKLEVFSSAAVSFLETHPAYLLFGTGPGLISIPATAYVSPIELEMYQGRIDTPPVQGFLLVLSNSGVLGLLVWFLMFRASVTALKNIRRIDPHPAWREGYIFLIVFGAYWLLQHREMWFLALGVGVGASFAFATGAGQRTQPSVELPDDDQP